MATSRVDPALVGRAVKALRVHDQRNQQKNQQLVDRASPVLVTIALKADNKGNTAIYQQVQRPVRVPIPHNTYNSEEDSTCLFVKSEDVEKVREMAEEGLIQAAEIISMNQVRKELERFGERKKVLSRHTHFFCDERITSFLYNSLGKVFLGKNKHPVPIRYSSLEALPAALAKGQASAYMHLKGVNISFKAGFADTDEEQLVENICQGLANAVDKINGKWRSIQAVQLKTPESFAIPIFSASQDDTLDLLREMHQQEQATAAREDKKAKKATGKRTKEETKEESKEEIKATKTPASARKATPNKKAKVQREEQEEEKVEQQAPSTPKRGKQAAEEKKAATTGSKRTKQQQKQQEDAAEAETAPASPVPASAKKAAAASAKKATPSKATGAKSAKKAAKESKVEELEEVPATPSRPKRARAASNLEAAEVPSTPATRTRSARVAASAKKAAADTPAAVPSAKKQRVASSKKSRAEA